MFIWDDIVEDIFILYIVYIHYTHARSRTLQWEYANFPALFFSCCSFRFVNAPTEPRLEYFFICRLEYCNPLVVSWNLAQFEWFGTQQQRNSHLNNEMIYATEAIWTKSNEVEFDKTKRYSLIAFEMFENLFTFRF